MTKQDTLPPSGQFRKKPVVIEAVQYTQAVRDAHLFDGQPLPEGVEIPRKFLHRGDRVAYSADAYIQTLEGRMFVSLDDWIITEVKGERYACKPDIFEATYESAALAAQAPQPEPRLTKEARVGGTTFGIGVPERFVVEAAQRAAEHPQGLVDKEAAGAFQRLIQENAERAAFLEAHPAITKELCDLIEENEKLKSIVAQAPQPIPLVSVGEDGEGQENHCPECGAEPGQMCSDEEGAEHGRKVHAVRQAPQQAETIAVQEAWEAAGGNPGIKATKADLLASLRLLDAVCDEAGAQEDRRKAQGVAAEWKLAAFPIEWTPGGNWFNDWIGQWFGPDADDDYIRKAVQSLLAAAPKAAPAFNPAATCSPTLTQCPRCNNPHHGCDGGAAPAPAPQALTEREPTTWSRYVAGMIAGYLKWPDDDERVEAVAGIIERRRWTEPKPEMAPMSPDQSASFQWLERLCEPSLYLDRLGPIRDYLRAHGIKAASAGGEG